METTNYDKQTVEELLANFDENFDYTGLPSSIIITNVPSNVFTDNNIKVEFEKLFRDGDHVTNIIYLPSFRRVRVEFDSPKSATYIRITLHELTFEGNILKAFFIEVPPERDTDPYLKLPPPFKNFLISPPTSPPEGWEQTSEAKPILNLDLLSALAQLTPGETHELQPETQKTPKIVVHIAEEEDGDSDEDDGEFEVSGATSTGEESTDQAGTKVDDGQRTSDDPNARPRTTKKKRKNRKGGTKGYGEKDYTIAKATGIHTPRPPLKT